MVPRVLGEHHSPDSVLPPAFSRPVSLAAVGSDTSFFREQLLQPMGGRKSNDRERNPARILTRVNSGAKADPGKCSPGGCVAHRGAAFESFTIWPKAGLVGSMTGGVPCARGT